MPNPNTTKRMINSPNIHSTARTFFDSKKLLIVGDYRAVKNLWPRAAIAPSISAANDQIANNTPLKRSAVVNIGNDSKMENAKSGKLAAIDEKSENASEKIWKNPDCAKLAVRLTYPATAIPTDTPNADAERTILVTRARRSRTPMRNKTFSVKPTGGSGVGRVEKSFS